MPSSPVTLLEELPGAVRVVPHVWVPMADGTRLAARLWLPVGEAPVPVILEYLPYRKGDMDAPRDHTHGAWFAGHGYAFARIDVRGTGDSDGVIVDEYAPIELADGVEAIAWLAAQPWCSGAVGMYGNSWGGFNALQIAALRPPALKAVVSCHSTDDRYADDVHYYGGCLLATEMLPWATWMLPMNALPPEPATVGEGWRATWLERLERTPPFVHAWVGHQRRDAYWRHGSVCEDADAIECAVLMVGGWADGYTNAVPRFLAGASCPRRGLIGQWAHGFPQAVGPGPRIGFLQECRRWWDRWLRGIANGVDEEPLLLAYLQEPVRAGTQHEDRDGRWVAERAWPPASVSPLRLHLGTGVLADHADAPRRLTHRGAQQHGLLAGAWCPHGDAADFPPDQRPEDALCLVFDGRPLASRLELLGRPRLRLAVAADAPAAFVVARLCAVAPDGTSTLLTRGALNLAHRDGHDEPRALEPGRRYEVDLELDVLGQAVAAGSRLRLALSTTYWPWLWPSPTPVTIVVETGAASWLELPMRAPGDGCDPGFGPPEMAAPPRHVAVLAEEPYRRVVHDVTAGTWVVEENQVGDETVTLLDAVPPIASRTAFADRFTIAGDDPLSARVDCERTFSVTFDGVEHRVETVSSMTADADAFHLRDALEAFEGAERVFVRQWSRVIPRDHV